jgi:hypothetical protein
MPVALPVIRDLLLPGLWAVTGKYPQLPRKWTRVFDSRPSKMALERSVSMRYQSIAVVKDEGAPASFDNQPGQRYVYNQEHLEFALAFSITRKAIADNLYKTDFGPNAMGLRDAFLRAEETYAADVLNSNATFNTNIAGDNVALGSTAHPVDGGTVSNLASPAASLSETSLLSAQIAINANWRDNANQRMNAKPKLLIIPPQLEPVAVRLLKTELRPGTSLNDINAILSVQGGIPGGYEIWNYLTSQFAWFLKTDQRGLVHMDREPYETDMSVEFTTDNLLVKGYMRQSWSYNDWRSIYISNATS